MKKFKRGVSFIVIIAMFTILFSAWTANDVRAEEKLVTGVTVTEVKVTKSNVKLKVKITNGEENPVLYGEPYIVERYENGKWVKLKIKKNRGFNSVGYVLFGKSSETREYNLKFLYKRKNLIPGKYRIRIDVEFKKSQRYAEFNIPEYKEVKLDKKKTVKVKKGTVIKLIPNTDEKVIWKSNNSKIATVNSKGVVKTKKKGKVIIKAKYGNKTLKCTIKVKNK